MECSPGLQKCTEQLKIANDKAAKSFFALEKEKRKIIAETVDTKTYCSTVGISRVTLTRRRNRGEISFVTIGAKYRYFLPKEGGEYVCV